MPTSRHFGPVESSTDYAKTTLARGGDVVAVDVNIAAPASLTQATLDEIDRAIDKLGSFHTAALAAFTAMMDDEASQPPQFWQFHHDDVEGYAELDRKGFVSALALRRVGFYPDGAFGTEYFVVLDFALRGPPSDQLLVAKFLRDRSLFGVSWES